MRFIPIFLISIILSGLAGWVSTRNSLFRLSEVKVLNIDDVELKSRIQERTLKYLGHNLFSMSLSEVERDISAMPSLRKVSVHRRFPSVLLINAEQRRPTLVSFRSGNLWTIDERGEFIERLERPLDLPLLLGLSPEDMTKQKMLLGELCAWLATLHPEELNETLGQQGFDEVHWDAERGIVLKLVSTSLEIELGHVNFMAAWGRARTALNLFKSRGISVSFLDASFAKRAVARLQNPANSLNLREIPQRMREIQSELRLHQGG